MLTEQQRAMIRSARLNATLQATVRRPPLANRYQRETQGADPWQTRSAPRQDADAALNRRALVT